MTSIVTWLQAHLPFGITAWPSWLTEGFGGAIFGVPALWLGWWWLLAVALGSELYERTIDPNGYSAQDVLERYRGILLVALGLLAWVSL